MRTELPVLLVFSKHGETLAKRVKSQMKGATIHAFEGRAEGDFSFSQAGPHIQALFQAGHPLIGFCAAGILIRLLAPCLSDKRQEPPVLCVAEDGSAVVPLLGGHHGANDWARMLGDHLGVQAIITTSGDVHFNVALDDPPDGYTVANPEMAKTFMARLLKGESARLIGFAPWILNSAIPLDDKASLVLEVTNKCRETGEGHLLYHPKNLVLGMGSERGACVQEAILLAEKALNSGNFSPHSLAAVVSLDLKADEAAIHAVADHFDIPALFYTPEQILPYEGRLKNPSTIVKSEVGVAGVAEGAALAASDGVLVVEKQKSTSATAAIAQFGDGDTLKEGQRRGRVFLVGVGPGNAGWRSGEAVALLHKAQDWVGYDLYLDLIADLKTTQTEHRFPLGAEEKRVRHALELSAKGGRDVAVVCSGDPGIFAMATLAYELIDTGAAMGAVSPAAKRTEIIVSPGISAFQAAAARAGAPIGHDFCCISLSDLLTPRADILMRLKAAAEGDFVTAFYNPRSKRRITLLDEAFDILRHHRPADTPVILATDLGRADEKVRIETLDTVRSDAVDMLTLVLVGSTNSKLVTTGDGKKWVYTPRGYHRKEGQ